MDKDVKGGGKRGNLGLKFYKKVDYKSRKVMLFTHLPQHIIVDYV